MKVRKRGKERERNREREKGRKRARAENFLAMFFGKLLPFFAYSNSFDTKKFLFKTSFSLTFVAAAAVVVIVVVAVVLYSEFCFLSQHKW